MSKTKGWPDFEYQKRFPYVIEDIKTGKNYEGELPELPCGQTPYEMVTAAITSLATTLFDPTKVFTSDELAAIQTRFVVDRLNGGESQYGLPRWRWVYAEQCAASLWEATRTILNARDRCQRHTTKAPVGSPAYAANDEYRKAAIDPALRVYLAHHDEATRAWIALKAGQPSLTDGELAKQVLIELDAIVGESSHPEKVPPARAMF